MPRESRRYTLMPSNVPLDERLPSSAKRGCALICHRTLRRHKRVRAMQTVMMSLVMNLESRG